MNKKNHLVVLSCFLVFLFTLLLFVISPQIENCSSNISENNRNPSVESTTTCHDPFSDRRYDIVFDAGSTGTRIHVFEYYRSYYNKETGEEWHPRDLKKKTGKDAVALLYNLEEQFSLLHDHVKRINPGISSYVLQPQEAGKSLGELLEFAKGILKTTPSNQSCVRITLKATAGMRLLPLPQQSAIMQSIHQYLKENPIMPSKDYSVEIIDGREEGLYGWLTLNYILDRMDFSPNTTRDQRNFPEKSGNTAAIVDMGGASSQIVFELDPQDGLWLPFHYFTPLRVYRKKETRSGERRKRKTIHLYQYSYLGLGLVEARREFLSRLGHSKNTTLEKERQEVELCFSQSASAAAVVEGCASLFHRYVLQSKHDEVGENTSTKICHYESCGMRGVPQPLIQTRITPVFVFSYFSDIINRYCGALCEASGDLGIVSVKDDRTEVKILPVLTFKKIAEVVCSKQNASLEDFFTSQTEAGQSLPDTTCFDVVYLYSYLSFGLEMDDNAKVYVPELVNGLSIAWPLGASLMSVHKMMED